MGSCNNFCSLWDACGYEYKGRCDCVGQRKFRPQIGMAPPPDALPSPEATPSPARGPQSPESREPLNARAAPIGDRIMKWRFRGSLTHDEFTEAMRLLRAIQAAPSPDPKLREAVDAFGDAVEALAKAEYRSSSEIELKPYKERYLAARANLLAPAWVDAGLREAVHAILGNGSDEERWPPGVEDHVALRTYVAKLEAARPHPEEQGAVDLLMASRYAVRKFDEWCDAGGKPNLGLCLAMDQLERQLSGRPEEQGEAPDLGAIDGMIHQLVGEAVLSTLGIRNSGNVAKAADAIRQAFLRSRTPSQGGAATQERKST